MKGEYNMIKAEISNTIGSSYMLTLKDHDKNKRYVTNSSITGYLNMEQETFNKQIKKYMNTKKYKKHLSLILFKDKKQANKAKEWLESILLAKKIKGE
jgi:hypothetical protein